MDWAYTLLDLGAAAFRAINSAGMVIALVLLAAILAAVAGFGGGRMRLYGAMVGGMVMNAVVKAEGGGHEAAFAAMAITTALGYALGGTGLLVKLLNVRKR
ncbi:MAG: hypothetical protein J0L88_10395 [Xanthomonadales bacterium]|jgi:hypothetical protein|nr:hypothetical protein [Xanthomonadales bacterium]MCC7114603.1 hypothetical protein [Burkholderiales bacterium]